MLNHNSKKDRVILFEKYDYVFFSGIITAILQIVALILSIIKDLRSAKNLLALYIVWTIAILAQLCFLCVNQKNKKEYKKIVAIEDMLSRSMQEIKNSNFGKTRCILQSTYGSMPKCHPFNYEENVLVYAVHEQIRTILIGIKKVIISTTEGLSDDQITVDLAYCYPINGRKNSNFELSSSADGISKSSRDWKIISSGDRSHMGLYMHDLLEYTNSFYSYLDEVSYAFENSKFICEKNCHYIKSKKDSEYPTDGSIVGITIDLKKDYPEEILIKGFLTITTYGKKLYTPTEIMTEDEYKYSFKRSIIDNYKVLLESEFAQMYIRHMIKTGQMDRYSGRRIYKASVKKSKWRKI